MIWLRVPHDETVSQTYRLVHPVRHHQGGKLVARNHLLGQREPGPRFWDQGPQCAQQKQVRTQAGGHEERKSLPLPS